MGVAGRSVGLVAIATFGCSLLAPSTDDLSSAYVGPGAPDDGGVTPGRSCAVGTKPCGDRCASIESPSTGCAGPSCAPCAAPHGAALCIAGTCALGPCENGWANCNGRADDGCETDTRSSSQFCGSCLSSCGGATPRCEESRCVPQCAAVRIVSASAHATFPTVGLDLGVGDVTWEAWLRRHHDFAFGANGVVLMSNERIANSALTLIASEAKISCGLSAPTPDGSGAVHVTAPDDGRWHHFACVRAAGELTVYLDGVARDRAANGFPLVADGSAAIGKPSGYPEYGAPPYSLGPMRISRTARYRAPFTPRTYWATDADTVAQWLTSVAYDGTTLRDEAGGDNDVSVINGFHADPEAP